jgi:hypothetical protein
MTIHLVINPRILPWFTGKPWRREPFPTAQKVALRLRAQVPAIGSLHRAGPHRA